ncbi:MAG TPA: YbaB/EbfC family nucleoid-associated protein [Patescibacteria group bacterium]|nr:YbaB/EbfC family nucleoid-associated protein [Patescibacteria group bacterium]
MFNKLKQFKDLRDRAKQIQNTLSQETVEGSANWGKVKIKMNGNQQVLNVTIDQSVMDDRVKLEGWIKDACNDAVQKVQQVMSTKLKDVGGLDLAAEFGDIMKK